MIVERDDFVMLHEPGMTKPVLAKVLKLKNTGYHVILSDERRAQYGDDDYKADVSHDMVVANLGPKPSFGKVYKADVEPYTATLQTKCFKLPIIDMVGMDEGEAKKVLSAAVKLRKVAKKYGFAKYIRNIQVLVKPGLTNAAGMWAMKKDQGERIILFLPCTDRLADNALPFDYVFFHEIGHHFWNLYMKPEEQARWVKLHRRGLSVEDISATKVTQLRAALEQAGSIKDYRKELDEEEKKIFSKVLSTVCKTMNVKPSEIDVLLAAGDNLSDHWITTPVPMSNSKIIITEYARKNPQELFAECVAHVFAGMEMPEKLGKITTNAIRKACERGPHGEVRSVTVTG